MSERQEKKRRIEQKLQYLAQLEAWLAEEPAWWNFFARKQWRDRRPKKPCISHWRGFYAGY